VDAILLKALERLIKSGTLQVTTAEGNTAVFGNGNGPPIAVSFASKASQRDILADPELRLGELYVNGQLKINQGTVADLLHLLLSQGGSQQPSITSRALYGARLALRRDWTLGPARRYQPLDLEIHLPGRIYSGALGVLPAVEKSGLIVTDVEILRLHYAETLRLWRERFVARWAEAVDLYDERFARLWEFYLAVSEMAFRHQGMMVFQMQIAKSITSVPTTRDYIGAEETRLRSDDHRFATASQADRIRPK